MEQKKNKYQNGIKEGWISILANSLLFIFKFWAGVSIGSIALIADAWHTLSDSLSSIIMLIGIKLSAKEADMKHPNGHGRIEFITSLVIAMLLALIGVNFISEAFEKFTNKTEVIYNTFAIVITAITILVKEGLAQYSLFLDRKTKSDLLRADAWHHRSDAISSIIILVGIFIGGEFYWLDSLLTVLVAILIIYTALGIFKSASSKIIGENLEKNAYKKIERICKGHINNDPGLKNFSVNHFGNKIQLMFYLKINESLQAGKVVNLIEQIKNEIRNDMGFETTIQIYTENNY